MLLLLTLLNDLRRLHYGRCLYGQLHLYLVRDFAVLTSIWHWLLLVFLLLELKIHCVEILELQIQYR